MPSSSNHFVLSRRETLQAAAAAVLGATLPARVLLGTEAAKGRLKQSACLWCYNGYMKQKKMDLDRFAAACAAMGLKSIELIAPAQWPVLEKHGLVCAMTQSHEITKGLNHPANHDECLAKIRKSIDVTSEAGFPNVICFSGNRQGMDDQDGLKHSVAALKKLAPYAEKKKVTLCLELLNSINHRDYMADHTSWCVELVRQVGSPRVKVLYDIYHAAMMKEDPLADIQKHHDCWGHYHTGGMPGRHEIDSTQTIDYPKLMRAIAASGYEGYVGQEFVPARPEALESLRQAVKLCDV